jgi:hypothetical protein
MITFNFASFFKFVDDGLVKCKNNFYNRSLVVFGKTEYYVWLVVQADSFLVSGLNVIRFCLK